MQPAFDLAVALRRLTAILNENPRGALERLFEHDPLALRSRASEVAARLALVIDPGAVAVAAYAGLLADVERLEPAARNMDATLVALCSLRLLRPPDEALCEAFAAALGTVPARAARVIEVLRGRADPERRSLLATLRATSQAIRTLLPGEAHDLRRDKDTVADNCAALRKILTVVFQQ